ncbi:thioredoxin-like protein [Pilatotrama ljubarskyi]|nr:thioredoxin-like protein [Pilatotrama ljubarskyi]
MAPTEQITLYTTTFSPYAHRVHIALEEAGARYKAYQINTQNKPDWYHLVNPFGKVPAITFGGPDVPPDQPSPESAKLVESLALLEFVADVFPEAKLLPEDPVLREKARAFISIYQSFVNELFRDVIFFATKPGEVLLEALAKLQSALPPTGFAVGEWSIADAAVIPFLARMFLYLDADLGKYSEEDGKKMRDAIASDRFARLRQYVHDLRERKSFKDTWGGDAIQVELGRKLPIMNRKVQ